MAYELRAVADAPLLGEIGFETKELRIFGPEEFLTLLIESTPTQHVKERYQIARLFNGSLVLFICVSGEALVEDILVDGYGRLKDVDFVGIERA